MKIKKNIYYLTPKRYRNFFKDQTRYAGIKELSAQRIVSFSYVFSLVLAGFMSILLFFLGFGIISFIVGIGCGLAVIGIIYILIVLIADSRAREIEKVLPDALQLMSANIRAGINVDRAIWLSARSEFGILEEEIKKVGARTMGGKPLKVALSEMSKNIKSSILKRTVRLLIEGIESGGELANLLEETASNIRVTQMLKKEIKSSVMTYSIFILFAAVIAAPFLFSISLFFVDVMGQLWTPEVLGGAQVTGAGFGMTSGIFAQATGVQITADELFWFALGCIIVTVFFGSLSIGLIQTGKEKNGLKFIPVLLGVAITILLLARALIGVLFGGIFAM